MEVTESPVVVGRGSHCTLVLDDPTVSTTHAEFVRRGGIVYVKDLNSTNGTSVNGERVIGERVLNPGDAVQVGNTFFSFAGGELRVLPPQIPQTEYSSRPRTGDGTVQLPVIDGPPAPPPGSSVRPVYVGRALSGWTNGLLWGSVGLISALILSLVFTLVFFEQSMNAFDNGDYAFDFVQRWEDAETFVGLFYVLWALLAIAIFVLLIVWSFRAHKATEVLNPGQRSWARGWTVGAWFIPLANYILVPMVLSEIHKISHAPRLSHGADGGWRQRAVPGGLVLWFVLYGVGGIALAIGQGLYSDPTSEMSYRVGVIMMLIGAGMIAGACVLAINFITAVSERLRSPEDIAKRQ